MPRASLKRAVCVKISDFPHADQELLRAAFHAFIPMVNIILALVNGWNIAPTIWAKAGLSAHDAPGR
jgi:hypothetical protein